MIIHQANDPRATRPYFETGKTLVEFYARWCGTCRALTRTLQAIEYVVGIPVVQVDIDDDPGLAAKFAILGVPQLLLLCDGVEMARASGSLDESEFAAWYAQATRR
ncbi:MAG: thioredoxin family protein [Bacillus subtilis]|nr:thioredoxin family protein [Bacillus subtilis]